MKVICDLRSEFPIKAIGMKKPEKKIRASTGFEPVTSAIPVRRSRVIAPVSRRSRVRIPLKP